METYVVRVYSDQESSANEDETDLGLRGVVAHVASGRSLSFHTADALVRFLADSQRGEGVGEGTAVVR